MNSVNTVGVEIDETTVELGLQLGVTAGFVLVMTIVHSLGLVAISRLLKLNDERLKEHDFNASALFLMAKLGLSVFVLHMVEITLFAGFYLAVDAVQTVEEALYYSASAYATLGRTAEYFPVGWRLIGAVEALIGFILIGWSTAFMVSTMRKLTEGVKA